jgi:23S rRNA (adenine2503-C2)-methyltransferase
MDHLLQLDLPSLRQWLTERGLPAYRAGQIQRWLFQHRVREMGDMRNLPGALRDLLADSFRLWEFRMALVSQAEDGTEKLLLEHADGGKIECVLLREGQRRSICISTQVGCAMGCVFCASGLLGVDRNLTTGEILEQVLRLQQRLPATERLSHVVVMGMGEPLANLDQLLPALDRVSTADGLGISVRRITISTVGLPAAMRRLARHARHYHLAVSLHAPNDELRNQLVPVNRQIGLREVLRAADEYFAVSGRRLTYEYVLLADVNDAPEHARQLAQLLRGRPALLNVIPYNPVVGLPYRTPLESSLGRFQRLLEQGGVNVQFRQQRGDAIQAACGQLRRLHGPGGSGPGLVPLGGETDVG